MKNLGLVILYCVISNVIIAQDKVDLEALKAPTSPASTIIGTQPNEVVQPKSVKDLEGAIMNNFMDDNNSLTLPNNYSLEAMPYWMADRKNVNYEDYLSTDFGNTFLQHLALSVSSTQNFVLRDSLNTNALGIGFRTLLRRGGFSASYKEILNLIEANRNYKAFQTEFMTEVDRLSDIQKTGSNQDVYELLVVSYKTNDTNYLQLNGDKKIQRDELLEAIEKEIDGDYENEDDFEAKVDEAATKIYKVIYKELKDKYSKYVTQRKGLQLEFAGSFALNFPTNDFGFSTLPKWGLWLTGTINPGEKAKNDTWKKNFQWILMVRYIRNDLEFYQTYLPNDSSAFFQNNLDLGTRIAWSKKKFSLEGEYIGRYKRSLLEKTTSSDGITTKSEKTDWENKLMLNLNYSINDNIVISYSIGQDLNPAVNINGNIISLVSMNFGFGGAKVEEEKDE